MSVIIKGKNPRKPHTVRYWVDGRQFQKSSKSEDINAAKKLRDQILGRKSRGEIGHEVGCLLHCAGRDGAGHGHAGAGVDGVTEPLERGLPAGAEHLTDVSPGLPGGTGTVDGCLQSGLGSG